jgi:regulator of sirC expression with transglutaminase-like and TPR domain
MTDSPVTYCRPEALRAFRAALPGLGTTRGLVDATVAIAQHELPMASSADVWARLCAIATRVRSRVRSPDPAALLAHAHDELFVVEGFTGDRLDYHAPENSYLPRVLARRRGLPIALVLVYKTVLGELGIDVAGIAAPGHFLAQVLIEGAPAYVDPFHGGTVLNRVEALARCAQVIGQLPPGADTLPECGPVPWLQRCLRNLEASFGSRQRPRDVHAMQELRLELDRVAT